MAQFDPDPARALGRRLRELRESRFPGVTITQKALGKALGGEQPISAPLISTWEKGTATPTARRIAAYATFFATSRSVEGTSYRVLRDDELNDDELVERETLKRELLSLRTKALTGGQTPAVPESRLALGGPWHFGDGKPIRIVCAEVPEEQRNPQATPTHPTLTYGELYSFAAIDTLFELFGHIRAANPRSDTRVLKAHEVEPDDLAAHLVVLGGVDRNPLARRLPEMVPEFPIRQVSDGSDPRNAYYEVTGGDKYPKYRATLSSDGDLISDVGLFLRTPNPANLRRTLTICNSMYGLGAWGVVRALTDERFRDRNEAYLQERLSGDESYGLLMQIIVFNGIEAVTPDWTVPANRLYEWPERTP
jgi:transcriptional regulator with XRE-family HTH domain